MASDSLPSAEAAWLQVEVQLALRGYEALERVGGGTFGRVYRARLVDDSLRALKVERSLGFSQTE